MSDKPITAEEIAEARRLCADRSRWPDGVPRPSDARFAAFWRTFGPRLLDAYEAEVVAEDAARAEYEKEFATGTFCPQCGPRVNVDEDGCCTMCGATATGDGVAWMHVRTKEVVRERDEARRMHAAVSADRDAERDARHRVERERDDVLVREIAAADEQSAQRAALVLRAEAAERERDEARAACAAMREALEKEPCHACRGRGKFVLPCSRCDDSTDDHACNEREVVCTYCTKWRAALSITAGRDELERRQRAEHNLKLAEAVVEGWRRRGRTVAGFLDFGEYMDALVDAYDAGRRK